MHGISGAGVPRLVQSLLRRPYLDKLSEGLREKAPAAVM